MLSTLSFSIRLSVMKYNYNHNQNGNISSASGDFRLPDPNESSFFIHHSLKADVSYYFL